MEKIELLPESRYSKEENGLIKEWLAGNLTKRTKFIHYLEEQYSNCFRVEGKRGKD